MTRATKRSNVLPYRRSSSSRSFLELGNTLYQHGDLASATKAYQTYLTHYPSDKHAHHRLAIALAADRKTAAAVVSYQQALQLDPWYPEALNNFGSLLHQQGQLAQAKVCLTRALTARPGYEDAEYNLANTESDAGEYDQAIHHFTQVLERNPNHFKAWNNLGKVLLALCQPRDALLYFQKALSICPDFLTAHWNMGISHLMLGNFKEGWPGFEYREQRRYADFPRWDGSDPRGKRILIHAEQGLGDSIQFIRYCRLLKDRGAYVVFESPPELLELFSTVTSIDALVPWNAPVHSFDFHVPLMSLPLFFGTTLETIPPLELSISVPDALVEKWRLKLAESSRKYKVGVVWAGNSAHPNDRNRSLDPKLLASLGQPEDVSFYCLQQKPRSSEITGLDCMRFEGVFDDLTFSDTAAIILNLDLVLSVDTAIVHLAGALGRPVWTLLPFSPDWRWMLERSDTPWYPTMRLFRQPRLHDWTSVLESVTHELVT